MVASTFAPTPTFSGLALAGFFHGSSAPTDAVQADLSYILTGPGQPGRVQQTTTASMSVLLNPFTCILAGSSPGTAGPQLWTTGSSPITVALADPDSVNPRVDLLTVQITQSPDGSQVPPVVGMASLVVMTGAAAASPIEPTPPAGSLVLARINVPAGVSATINNAAIVPRQSLGGLRGGTVRGHQFAFGRVTRPGQFYYQEWNDRVFLTRADGTLRSIPGFGSDWPDWYLTGVPSGFTVPNNVGTAAMAFASATRNVGVSIATMTTGAIVTTTESGAYQLRASATIAAGSAGNNRRMLLERRNSAGVKQERIQMEPFWNANIGPRFNCVGRMRMNAGDQIFAALFQDSGVALAPINTDLDWVFEGYKVADL